MMRAAQKSVAVETPLIPEVVDAPSSRGLVSRRKPSSPEVVVAKSEAAEDFKRSFMLDMESKKQRQKIFASRPFLLCGLPYDSLVDKKTGKRQTQFVREARVSKDLITRVTFSTNKAAENQGEVPYGKDRVLWLWIFDQAVKKGSRIVKLPTILEYLREIGSDPYSGSTKQKVLESLMRLEQLTLRIDYLPTPGSTQQPRIMREAYVLFNLVHLPGERLDPSFDVPEGLTENDFFVMISEDIWREIKTSGIPLDFEYVRHLLGGKGRRFSPMLFDLGIFISYRAWLVANSKDHQPARISLKDLKAMLGTTEVRPSIIQRSIVEVVKEVKACWPSGIRIEMDKAGNLLIYNPEQVLTPLRTLSSLNEDPKED